MLIKTLAVASGFALLSSSSFLAAQQIRKVVVNAGAPGTILVEVAGNSSSKRRYSEFEIHPALGQVRLAKEELANFDSGSPFPASESPAESFDDCRSSPEAASPDKRLLARCTVLPMPKSAEFGRPNLVVMNEGTSTTLYHWTSKTGHTSAGFKEERDIKGFAWAPNSRAIAVLNGSEHYRKDPLGVLAGLSGHPIPHTAVYLDIVDVQTGNVTEYLLRKDVSYSSVRILSWSK
jgi:hypothetical protein